ncbi:MAG: sulfotransferase family protein [Rhodobacteraceae bacterium]|nr:sulfotransferase family protein [Paracoccaceae bacterium]
MIVSTGRGYVFVHIPKTGGTALGLALEARAMRDDILIGDTPKARRRRGRLGGLSVPGRLWKHATLADVDGIVPGFAGLFAFTLVRNPWDRMVSLYHWLQRQTFDHPAVGLARRLTFEAFVLHPVIAQSVGSSPARSYMTGRDGRERCDLYIRLERFEADSGPLWAHLGFRLTLPVANTSDRRRDWRGYYSDRAADAVARLCAEDIGRFGYGFDGMA